MYIIDKSKRLHLPTGGLKGYSVFWMPLMVVYWLYLLVQNYFSYQGPFGPIVCAVFMVLALAAAVFVHNADPLGFYSGVAYWGLLMIYSVGQLIYKLMEANTASSTNGAGGVFDSLIYALDVYMASLRGVMAFICLLVLIWWYRRKKVFFSKVSEKQELL